MGPMTTTPPSETARKTNPSKKQQAPEDAACTQAVLQKIDLWRKYLLDLTRRNKLLYFSQSKGVVKILTPSPSVLFDEIVNDGHQLAFPMPKKEHQLVLTELEWNPEEEEARRNAEADIKPGDLETSVPVRELQTRLFRLRREWKTWQEEQGVHTLFLALGIVHWREAEQENQECLAPLILVPVGLNKDSADKPYKLEFVEEDIVVNPALVFKLQRDYGIELPELKDEAEGEDIVRYFDQLAQKVKVQGWSVSHESWLGRFSFEKYVMYQDLERHRDAASQHPLIRALTGCNSLSQPMDLPSLEPLDEAADPEEVFPVLDADSSQLEVLIRARAGQHLVVHGPPGTGKSQTIVNLIAQALRDGKKVLFVSEKMAALEVVYRRLKETGIAMGCLEVHSHHSNKAVVIEELGRTLQQQLAPHAPGSAEDNFKALVRRRDALNQYVRELHKSHGTLRLSAYQVHGRLAKLSDVANLEFKLPWEKITEVTSEALDQAVEAINRIARVARVVDSYSEYPWLHAEINLPEYSLQYRDRMVAAAQALVRGVDDVCVLTMEAARDLSVTAPKTFEQTEQFVCLLEALGEPVRGADQWLSLERDDIAVRFELVNKAKKHAEEIASLKQGIFAIFKPTLFDLPVGELSERFQKKYAFVISRWMDQEYWQDRKTLRGVSNQRRITFEQARKTLTETVQLKDHEEWFQKQEPTLEARLGLAYKGGETNWDAICASLEWVERLQEHLPNGKVSAEIVRHVQNPLLLKTRIKETCTRLAETLKDCQSERELFASLFQARGINGLKPDETQFLTLKAWLEAKRNPKDLDDWVAFLQARASCQKVGLGDFVEAALKHGPLARLLVPSFLKQFWKAWLAEAYRQSPALLEFRGERHEDIIAEFRRFDRDLKKITAALVCETIDKRQPKRSVAQSGQSQVGILLRETQKRRRHMPLRRLFSEIPHLIQELKPCLLMSPLSVASYLKKGAFQFDLVIFDEASQIPPADAIGSILRGSQVIVAGDDKQLPPTRFFQADLDDYEEEESNTEPLESILNDCKALPGFIERPLAWHYRSRFEELIAFSNRCFYRSELVTFPSPHPTGMSGAVRFVHVAEGVYDRGGSRTNRIEAKRVVDLIAEHFRIHGMQRALGVITLNLAQEEMVLEEWERRKQTEPELAAFAGEQGNEPFFIKALEKVQGDERDHIIITIGYGRDKNGGNIPLNFGPINQQGGERRLNVAVTRARYQMTVVCSFLPHELDLARLTTGSEGVRRLQEYLEYAKNGGRFSEVATGHGTVELNDFEEAVKQGLESHGLTVDGQVGCSGFRIDLGIRHPEHPQRYILGIECDGATYHSHRTARDRDRLRQEVLEALGWKLHRIWSTDWIKTPKEVVKRVLDRLEELQFSGTVGVEAAPQQTAKHDNPGHSSMSVVLPADEPKTMERSVRTTTARLPSYEPYCPLHKRQQTSLYEAEHRPGRMNTLIEDMQTVVKAESPVHPELLAQRIGDLYGFERIGNRVEEIVNKAIELAVREGKIARRDGFLWKDKSQTVSARRGGPGGEPRNVEYVAREELAAAAEWVLGYEYGLPKDALIRETAEAMGYSRTGDNVRERIEKAIEWLLKQGKVTLYGDQIILAKGT